MIFYMDCETKGSKKKQDYGSNDFWGFDLVWIEVKVANEDVDSVENSWESENGEDGFIIKVSFNEDLLRIVLGKGGVSKRP